MNTRWFLVAAVMCTAGASTVRAQDSSTPDSAVAPPRGDSGVVAHVAVRSSIDQPVALRRVTRVDATTAMSPERRNLGQPRALMIVGGAAFIAGALIEGDAGRILMVSGAIVGVYGLYEYLR